MAVLAIGLLVIVGGWALAYRYTISPKAGERMAEANRRYSPPARMTDPIAWRDFAIVWVAWSVFRLVAHVVSWPPALAVAALGVLGVHVLIRRDKSKRAGDDGGARGGTRTPTSGDTGT